MRKISERKKEGFLAWRRTKREEDREEYRRRKRVVKRMVREAKKKAKEKWSVSIAERLKEDKKTFWKGLNEVIKGES